MFFLIRLLLTCLTCQLQSIGHGNGLLLFWADCLPCVLESIFYMS